MLNAFDHHLGVRDERKNALALDVLGVIEKIVLNTKVLVPLTNGLIFPTGVIAHVVHRTIAASVVASTQYLTMSLVAFALHVWIRRSSGVSVQVVASAMRGMSTTLKLAPMCVIA